MEPHGQFIGLTGRQPKRDGAALSIGDHVSLGPKAATRAAKRFTMISLGPRSPPLAAPAAFWCARTFVPSRNTIPSWTPRSCTRLKRRSQAPARDQRKDLRRPPPGSEILRNGPPLGAVLMPPEDRRERAPDILGRRLGLGPAGLNQELQFRRLRVTQHRPSCLGETKTQAQPIRSGDDRP